MTEQTFTVHQLMQITGLSYRQVDYWSRTGRVTLSNPAHHSPGSGVHRQYVYTDLVAFMTMSYGVSVTRVKYASWLSEFAVERYNTGEREGWIAVNEDHDKLTGLTVQDVLMHNEIASAGTAFAVMNYGSMLRSLADLVSEQAQQTPKMVFVGPQGVPLPSWAKPGDGVVQVPR